MSVILSYTFSRYSVMLPEATIVYSKKLRKGSGIMHLLIKQILLSTIYLAYNIYITQFKGSRMTIY